MAMMFPDSGVPPSDARNSLPDVDTVPNCAELWYSTSRCEPRFDAAAANAMLSENMNLIMKGEANYDCVKLNNLEVAVRYIVQRGLPCGVLLNGGPLAYNGVMDPPLTRYNNYFTPLCVPIANNNGPVTVDLGKGPVPLLRNDYQPLESKDLKSGVPVLISYWNGNFLMVGLCDSQVPLVVKGGIDVWIRTDGNDATGDGTANDPAKAFRTIKGAWASVGSRYASSPLFSVNLKLGIPGTYEGAAIGPFGGKVTLTGDIGNIGAYRIASYEPAPNWAVGLWVQGINNVQLFGVTVLLDKGAPYVAMAIRVIGSGVTAHYCRFEAVATNNGTSYLLDVGLGGIFSADEGTVTFEGNGNTIACAIYTASGASVVGSIIGQPGQYSRYYFNNLTFTQAGFSAGSLSSIYFNTISPILNSNTIGPQYAIYENSVIAMGGQIPPGNAVGTEQSGGVYAP